MSGVRSFIAIKSAMQGHHAYKNVLTLAIGESQVCKRELYNLHDPFAVAVYNGSTIVGHVSRHISAMCYTFLGKSCCCISCKITGHRRYVRDSPKGGLEVTCHFIFHGEEADIKDIRNLIALLNTAQLIEENMNILEKRLQR